MKRFTFGIPEKNIPSLFCPTFRYIESPVVYDVSKIQFRRTERGCCLFLPLSEKEAVYGLGL